jgi:lipopolysaccharide transport system ATP-binding protein
MSSERLPAIAVQDVSKQYRYGAGADGRLADALQRWTRAAVRRGPRTDRDTFWALRGVSLQVMPGELVGVIGRNGAGKSTLLKLLARITTPTEGQVLMRGRVASLLEVGAGFDPELSGRENVFLSGAILGMRAREIADKFDEIVAFSGVERFIDTPVKRYSSGMFVRLAFAVGAHLESDILLIDEVLSVGDAEFQRKCVAKMAAISDQGRTVVFVSHNLHAVQQLCPRAYLLDGGRLATTGPTDEVVSRYLELVGASSESGTTDVGGLNRAGSGDARLQRVALLDHSGNPTERLFLGQTVRALLTFDVAQAIPDAIFQLGVSTADGMRLATAHSTDGGKPSHALEPGVHTVEVAADLGMLPGNFLLDVAVYHANESPIDHLDGALAFHVVNVGEAADDRYPLREIRGAIRPRSTWSVVRDSGSPMTSGSTQSASS